MFQLSDFYCTVGASKIANIMVRDANIAIVLDISM